MNDICGIDSAVPTGLISSALLPGTQVPGYFRLSLGDNGKAAIL